VGLLDEAIREHLELKRRRGADASEVARQESEALGPDTRVPEALEVPQPAVEDYPAEPAEALADPVDDLPVPEAEPPPPEIPGQIRIDDPPVGLPEDLEGALPPSAVGQPTAEFDVPAHHDEDPQPAAGPVAPEHAAPSEVPAPPLPPEAPDAEHPAPEAPHPDDVLEETPEFLQETPEHDRLWFEQRPPRDFDFDK